MLEQDMTTDTVLIGGGELGRCPTRIHHQRFTVPTAAPDPVIERRIADGRRWEATVMDRIPGADRTTTVTAPGDPFDAGAPVEIASGVDPESREEITLTLLRAGVPIVTGARLSRPSHHSVGQPDLLVRLPDGYAPVEVKHHLVVGRSGISARSTPIGDLTATSGTPRTFRPARSADLLQTAHYWTLLDTFGLANTRHLAGVIGAEAEIQCLWVDLDAGRLPVLSRYATALSTAIETVSAGREHPDTPLVPPVWRGECRGCPWAPLCRSELEAADHVSLLPAVRAADTKLLLDAGITTTATIARLTPATAPPDLDNPGEAILQAKARSAGALLPRAGEDLSLPDAALEVDFDVETYHGVLYLAGLLISEDGTSRYRPFTDWTGEPDGERRVLADLFRFFDGLVERGDFVVYHWTGYERTILKEAGRRHGLSLTTAPSVDAWFDRYACDLWAWTKRRFVSPNGYSLKVVAPLCGFNWRDDDPGGAQSEIWYSDLLEGDLSQRPRLLAYNEDDVVAQLAIRRWVRARHPISG